MDRNEFVSTISKISRRGSNDKNNQSRIQPTTKRGNVDESIVSSILFTCASQFVSSLAHVYYPTIRSLSEISETDRQDLLLCAVENTPDLLRMVEERLNSVSTTQSESSVSQVV